MKVNSNVAQYLSFDVTQGGADTAAEQTLSTPLAPGTDLGAWLVHSFEVHYDPTLVKSWSADADLSVQLTARSLSGSITRLDFDDGDLIARTDLALSLTTSGSFIFNCRDIVEVNPGSVVYDDEIFVQVISTGTGATNRAFGRLVYYSATLTQDEALAIVAVRAG